MQLEEPATGAAVATEQPEHSMDTRQVWNGMWRAACSCGQWSLFVPQEEEALHWADAHSRRIAPKQEETLR